MKTVRLTVSAPGALVEDAKAHARAQDTTVQQLIYLEEKYGG